MRGHGILVVAVADPEIRVSIDNGTIEIFGAYSQEISLRPGTHHIRATWRGVPFRNEDITVTRRGKRVLRIERMPSDSASKLFSLWDQQRTTIESVLRLGGQVKILVNWAHRTVTDVREIPSAPFQIESISLSDNPLVGDNDLLSIAALKSIHRLYLAHTQITDAGLVQIAKLNHLEVLSLATTQITDEGIRHLRSLQELDKLDLERTGLNDEGLRTVCDLPKLSRLNITHTRVTDQGMKNIPRLTNLEVLYLAGTLSTDESIDSLKQLKSLRELMLSGTGLTEQGIARLKEQLPDCTFASKEDAHLW